MDPKIILWIWYALALIGSIQALGKAKDEVQLIAQVLVSGFFLLLTGWAVINV